MMNTKALYQLLRQRRFADVEQFFAKAQLAFESGNLDEYDLADTYNVLCFKTIPSMQWLEDWFQAMPQSYSACLLLALWCQDAGWDARGSGTAGGMGSWFERAKRYAEQSISLTSKPLLSYGVIGNIARGSRVEIDLKKAIFPDWYTAGLSVLPDSKTIRILLMQSMRPEWGGSQQMLQQYVAMHREHPLHDFLGSAMHRFLLHHAAYFKSDWSKVEHHLAEAKRLDPTNIWTSYWHALALNVFDRMAQANAILREQIKQAPHERELYFQLGAQLGAMDLHDEVLAAYKPLVINGDARAIELSANLLMDSAEEKDDKRAAADAKEHYEYLVDGGHDQAGNRLANLYFNGKLVAKDVKRAFEYAKVSADQGNEYSCQLIWNRYRMGDLTDRLSKQEALDYLSKAWRLGNPYGLTRVIEAIEEGYCALGEAKQLHATPSGAVSRETLAMAFGLRRDAALAGDVDQQKYLAKLMMEGNEYFPPDKVAGLKWYEMAADQGDDYAQVMLGWYYARGEHCELNYEKAIPWLELALEQDNEFAYYELGRLCLDGLGQPRDIPRALELLEVSAQKHKRSSAFELLASRYFYGVGLPEDRQKARYWMEQARNVKQLSSWMTHQLSVFEASGLGKMFKRFTPKDKAELINPLPN
jgi:TPR repeat protein